MREVPFPKPGEILAYEFLGPMGISTTTLATATGLSEDDLDRIVGGSLEITEDTGRRLSTFLGTYEGFGWAYK